MAARVITEAPDYLTPQSSKTTQPAFDCRIRQRGAKWHWQVVNADQVLAYGSAESHLAARNAVVLQCLKLIHP